MKVTDSLTLKRKLQEHCKNDAECKRLAKQAQLTSLNEPEPMPRTLGDTVSPSAASAPKP